MDEFTNYPLAPFVNALRTVVGRVILGAFAVVLGTFLAGLSAIRSSSGGVEALGEFSTLLAGGIFVGYGILVIPLVLLFVILFARSEWPLWTVAVVALLVWWSFHLTIRFAMEEGPMAKLAKALRESAVQQPLPPAEPKPDEPEVTVSAASPTQDGGRVDRLPIPKQNPTPTYPPESLAAGEKGLVLLRLKVDATGKVTEAEITKSSGFERLDKAAKDVVQQWKFQPALRDGKPVEAIVQLPIRWKLPTSPKQ